MVAIGISASVVAATGCSPTSVSVDGQGDSRGGTSASRVELYGSVADLAEDSSIVLVGTVSTQQVATDIDPTTPFTLSTLTVMDIAKPNGSFTEGSTVIVRQIGADSRPTATTLMETGRTYLVYLTPSGLAGELASQFYITGGNAGLYQATDKVNVFAQVQQEEGDTLPGELNLQQAKG